MNEKKPAPEMAGAGRPAVAQAGARADLRPEEILGRLHEVALARRGTDPDRSYVARLFSKGQDAILKKIGEEATETVLAAKDGVPERIIAETADLWFHCVVMLAYHELSPVDVLTELARREGLSGLEEKARRAPADRSD